MALGTTIRIYLTDGTPEGLRIVEKSNWNGVALVGPRSVYPEVRERTDFEGPGVYVLRGWDDDNASRPSLYIGEADVVRKRLDSHLRHKDWWEDFVVFASKDENLNKAYVKHLESRLVAIARRLKRVRLKNGTTPAEPRMSEADRDDAEGFLINMRLIYPVLGIDAFEEPRTAEPGRVDRPLLHLAGRHGSGTGRDLPEGFVVYAGALARSEEVDSLSDHTRRLRREFLNEGVLVPEAGDLRLTQDYLFGTPSGAASLLLGRNTNGRIRWRDGEGRTLKEIQKAAIPSADQDDEQNPEEDEDA